MNYDRCHAFVILLSRHSFPTVEKGQATRLFKKNPAGKRGSLVLRYYAEPVQGMHTWILNGILRRKNGPEKKGNAGPQVSGPC